ncbi:MAG: Rnf-Nqr domain containing protein [Clostridia bacterium]|nr:Rnf-Nqr domain containing protein [Clostridia bacterium]
MNIFLGFLSAIFYMGLSQNLVFSGGFGSSEVIRTAARPGQLKIFFLSITFFSTITALVSRLFLLFPRLKTAEEFIIVIVFVLILIAIYFLTLIFVKIALSKSSWKQEQKEKFYRQISIAALNTIVLALPFISKKTAFGILDSVGAGLGAGLAFIIATFFLNEGMKRLEKKTSIPKSFKGTAIVFLYMGIIAMAFTGFSGKSLFF